MPPEIYSRGVLWGKRVMKLSLTESIRTFNQGIFKVKDPSLG